MATVRMSVILSAPPPLTDVNNKGGFVISFTLSVSRKKALLHKIWDKCNKQPKKKNQRCSWPAQR